MYERTLFKTEPVVCKAFEIGDSEYVCGIFEPPNRKHKRFNRTVIVVRNFIGTHGNVEVVRDPRQFPEQLKSFAKTHGATYPASSKEHQSYLSVILQIPTHALI